MQLRLLTDSIFELQSNFDASKKLSLQTTVEQDAKLRDFKYTLDFYKDDMNAHEERVKRILDEEFQANRKKWIKEKGNWEVMQG